ncbi:nucleotidyltransferase domain-containing protein [soil metagenome]
MENIKYKDAIIKIVEIFFPQAKIYLFGSYARGTNRIGSDIDIAIDSGRPLSFIEINRIARLIDALSIAQRVDIVDFVVLPLELKKEILENGVPWKI